MNKAHYQKEILSLLELNEFDEGDVNLILDFGVSNKIYGPPLKIILRIIPAPKKRKIIEFLKEFGLSEMDYPDERILKILETYIFMIESKRVIKPIGNSSFLYNLTPEIIYNIRRRI